MSKAAVALVVSALLLASCGDDEEPEAATTTTEAALVLTPEGFGDLRIGMTVEEASATGAIGEIGESCELAGPTNQGAPLVDVEGSVTFDDGELTNIDIYGDAETAEGVGPGDSLDDLRSTYDEVEVDETSEDVFGIWIARVPDGYEVVVDPATEEITSIAAPIVLLCD